METNKTYTITLSDGTVLENLALNGNNFISQLPVDPAIFEYNCSPVIINDGETDDIHQNMELVQVVEYNGEYWFVLRDLSDMELTLLEIRSDIAYTAMMAGVDI